MMPVGLLSSLHLGAGLHNLQKIAIHLQLAGSSGSAACLGRCSTSSAMLAEAQQQSFSWCGSAHYRLDRVKPQCAL